MRVAGRQYRTIWVNDHGAVEVIDQSRLPFDFRTVELRTAEQAARAIREMWVRGAPLIGMTAAYGLALAACIDPSDAHLDGAEAQLAATRPTAHNLRWALAQLRAHLQTLPARERPRAAMAEAARLCEADVQRCRAIGEHGLALLRRAHRAGRPLNVLTHCNAGWLACVDFGTALAPVYLAHDEGLPVHVWVDETRPRNQGASLTAFELAAQGVPHTVIADNLGGLLMQQGRVDLVVVGADRVTANGDVCNKVGTYLKALAARDNGVPFYAALPLSTIDWSLAAGPDVPIEQRDAGELTHMAGQLEDGSLATVRVVPAGSAALNLAFDVTPARLVTALITERGVCEPSAAGLAGLYPEHADHAATSSRMASPRA